MSDPNYSSVSLLLHFDGANGSTTFTDNSPSPKTVTKFGDAQISTTQSKFGGSSAYFDGTGDYLSIPSSNDFLFGTNDFTVELWLYRLGASDKTLVRYGNASSTSQPGSWEINIQGNNLIGFFYNYYTSSNWLFSSAAVVNSTWTHIAVTKSNNTLRIFINGVLSNSGPFTTDLNYNNGTLWIGGTSSQQQLNGYIDDLRITKGVARYTNNFSPPTEAFPDSAGPAAKAADPGPLGSPNVLALVEPMAIASTEGPLGRPQILGQQSLAYASAPSILGPEQVTGWQLFGRADAPSVLGNANLLAWHLFARADVPSMLGAATTLAVHDFTGQLGDATTYYVMDLTTPSGTVRVPISSWQATLQTGLSNYVQCVVPAVQSYVTQINAATQFKILRRVVLPDGFVIEYQMASGPLQTVTLDQGPFRYTATIAGYSSGFAINETPSPAYNRTMSGLRSVSVSEGKARVRCSIDWLLRPSQRVFAGDRNFIASYINYYVGNNDAYMEVGER